MENFDGWYGTSPNVWVRVDGTGDFGRQGRQQDFLILALQQAFDSGFRNPLKITEIIQEVLGGGFVTLDDRLTPEKAIQVAQQFRNFQPNELKKYQLPTVYDFADELSIQRIIESQAEPILEIFRGSEVENTTGVNTSEQTLKGKESQVRDFAPISFNVQSLELLPEATEVRAQPNLTNEEKRAQILERAGKIRGC